MSLNLTLRLLRKHLASRIGASRADDVIQGAAARQAEFGRAEAPPSHPVLNRHLSFLIYPSASLYLALQAEGWERDDALSLVEEASLSLLSPVKRALRVLGRLPFFFDLFRWITRWGMPNTFPPSAWETEWLKFSRDAIEFNFHACYYVATLTRLDAPELTPIFCKMDRYFYDEVSPYLRFERANTLAITGLPCDFRFYRDG